MKGRHGVRTLLASCALGLACSAAVAQGYPSKPIRLLVGYPPGGSNDTLARIAAPRLAERLGRPVVVENRPGADSMIATEYVARAAPDGYTFLVSAMVFNPELYGRLPYDPLKDFTPITMLVADPLVLAAHPSLPAASMKDLLALAKAKPGALAYASGSPPMYVATELFKKKAGVDIVHVPYKGSGPSIIAAVAGEVPLVVVTVTPALAQLRAGKLRALAVTSKKRTVQLPATASLAEAGVDFQWLAWIGMFGPARLPAAVVDRLYGELAAILKSESVRSQYAALGYDLGEATGVGMPPAEFAPYFAQSLGRWTDAVKDLRRDGAT
ncbi:MAG: tripartite tricarboxylate transporter substrate binding protein [Burkholderiales bacterium]|nr:tripartite tricarboxylate transporter substrate binding protein [Burkholderiales bacterium]